MFLDSKKYVTIILLVFAELVFQHECYLEFTATDNIADPTVRQKSAECLMEHCQSAAFDFWVLTDVFRPTRKILFVYVSIANTLVVCFNLPILEESEFL